MERCVQQTDRQTERQNIQIERWENRLRADSDGPREREGEENERGERRKTGIFLVHFPDR